MLRVVNKRWKQASGRSPDGRCLAIGSAILEEGYRLVVRPRLRPQVSPIETTTATICQSSHDRRMTRIEP